jgi:hypothetical protein
MRLAAQAKMGYYPTPQLVVSLISCILLRSNPDNTKILDPSAGVEFYVPSESLFSRHSKLTVKITSILSVDDTSRRQICRFSHT